MKIWGKSILGRGDFKYKTLNVRTSSLVKGTEGTLLLCKDFQERLANLNFTVSGLGV